MDSSFKLKHIEIIKRNNSVKMIELYESELIQVILNILKNAQDNLLEKKIQNPQIIISCEDTPTGVDIHIYDNGGGIADDIIEHIFDPYFSTKDAKNGTGLGLYMSKMIIEEHYFGSLAVTNTNQGACFNISLKESLYELP